MPTKKTATNKNRVASAQNLLNRAESVGAAHVEYRESDYPDTSWMDARQLKQYKNGDIEFYDTLLIDDTDGSVIGSLTESSVGKGASARAYLHGVGLELVEEYRADVLAAIKRAR